MEKIKFIKSNIIYEGITDFISTHVITIKFNGTIPSQTEIVDGFEILNENNNHIQADYTEFNTIYRTYDDPYKIDLSDDNSIYINHESIYDQSDQIIYRPTQKELDIIFKNHKAQKIALSKKILAEYLENNPIHSFVHGGIDCIYSVTSEKQNLMMSRYMIYQIEKNINPDAKLTWNATGKSCTEWTEEEFLQLILEIKEYVYPLVSYQQHLEEQIYKCTTQEELDQIVINYNLAV